MNLGNIDNEDDQNDESAEKEADQAPEVNIFVNECTVYYFKFIIFQAKNDEQDVKSASTSANVNTNTIKTSSVGKKEVDSKIQKIQKPDVKECEDDNNKDKNEDKEEISIQLTLEEEEEVLHGNDVSFIYLFSLM